MQLDNIHSDYRKLVLKNESLLLDTKQLRLANMELTAALNARGEDLRVYKEMAHGVLFKQVDRYLQAVTTDVDFSTAILKPPEERGIIV